MSQQKLTPHHKRIRELATAKLSELLVFDEASQMFRVERAHGRFLAAKMADQSQELDSAIDRKKARKAGSMLGEVRRSTQRIHHKFEKVG